MEDLNDLDAIFGTLDVEQPEEDNNFFASLDSIAATGALPDGATCDPARVHEFRDGVDAEVAKIMERHPGADERYVVATVVAATVLTLISNPLVEMGLMDPYGIVGDICFAAAVNAVGQPVPVD